MLAYFLAILVGFSTAYPSKLDQVGLTVKGKSLVISGTEDKSEWIQFKSDPNFGLYKEFYQHLNFFEARQVCQSYGADLASFESFEEFEFLKSKYFNLNNLFIDLVPSNDFWVGLFHKGENLAELPNYKLFFADSTPYTLTSNKTEHSKYWGEYAISLDVYPLMAYQALPDSPTMFEPNNFKNEENCVFLHHYNPFHLKARKLNDHNCLYTKSAFICRFRYGNVWNNMDIEPSENELTYEEEDKVEANRAKFLPNYFFNHLNN